MESYEKIAKILRADKDTLKIAGNQLEKLAGKFEVFDLIWQENIATIDLKLSQLGLHEDASAKRVYNALIKKINNDNNKLSSAIGVNSCNTKKDCKKVCGAIHSVLESKRKGFFLKKDTFIEILHKTPPKRLIAALDYQNITEMVYAEDWREIASALRFFEGTEWINSNLLEHYKKLTPDDFEEREIQLVAISDKWKKLAGKFGEKKRHNISHLKELGIIFIVPMPSDLQGELIRTVALVCHYINEIFFYSDLFKKASKNKSEFVETLVSLISGYVVDDRSKIKNGDWLIVQRYLAKDDENDWRLFEPHVNPEAIHWEKAEAMIDRIGGYYGINDMSFWRDLNWVGDYFQTDVGIDALVSFNLIDTSMSLVKKKEMVKYLYHHQESLWNKIFSSYLGTDRMEEIIKENIVKGYISTNNIKLKNKYENITRNN